MANVNYSGGGNSGWLDKKMSGFKSFLSKALNGGYGGSTGGSGYAPTNKNSSTYSTPSTVKKTSSSKAVNLSAPTAWSMTQIGKTTPPTSVMNGGAMSTPAVTGGTTATNTPSLSTGGGGGSAVGGGGGISGGGGVVAPAVDMNALARKNADSMYASAEAGYAKTRDQALLDVTKAYNDAIAQGKLSETEAMDAYNNAVKQINESAYRDSQLTNAMAYDRGIGNSQQMLGLMAGDNARANNMRTDVLTERDKRINTLKDRIASLTKEKDLDTAQINKDYNYDITQAKSESDRYYNDFLLGQASGNYGGGGGGGSRGDRANTDKYNVNDASGLIDQYKDFVASKSQTALDQYYNRINNVTKRSVMDTRMPLGAPPSVASNNNLTAYQKMKMFQNDFGK